MLGLGLGQGINVQIVLRWCFFGFQWGYPWASCWCRASFYLAKNLRHFISLFVLKNVMQVVKIEFYLPTLLLIQKIYIIITQKYTVELGSYLPLKNKELLEWVCCKVINLLAASFGWRCSRSTGGGVGSSFAASTTSTTTRTTTSLLTTVASTS